MFKTVRCCAERLIHGYVDSDCIGETCTYVPECCVDGRIRCGIGELIARMLNVGCKVPISRISAKMDWQDFEDMVYHMVGLAGYQASKGPRIGKGQYDVVAARKGHALVIEAKRWKVYGNLIERVVRDHVRRVARDSAHIKLWARSTRIYPVVVTGHDVNTRLVLRVPIVSAGVLAAFLREFEDYMEELLYF